MKIVVNANIVFSGILNTNSTIADLLINSQSIFTFISPDFLQTEIRKHYHRIRVISGLTLEQIKETELQLCKYIIFVSPEQISQEVWIASEKLVRDIDPKDTPYIAVARHFRCTLWSGDKQLMKGLIQKNFKDILSTADIFKLRNTLRKSIN